MGRVWSRGPSGDRDVAAERPGRLERGPNNTYPTAAATEAQTRSSALIKVKHRMLRSRPFAEAAMKLKIPSFRDASVLVIGDVMLDRIGMGRPVVCRKRRRCRSSTSSPARIGRAVRRTWLLNLASLGARRDPHRCRWRRRCGGDVATEARRGERSMRTGRDRRLARRF